MKTVALLAWSMGLGVVLASLPGFAGSGSIDSAAFSLDLRYGNRPVVAVTSQYFNKNKPVYFLDGVPLLIPFIQQFTAQVDWNGKTPQQIIFITPKNTYNGLETTRSFDVKSEFGVGGHLVVYARASDGTESDPCWANFEVIPPPPIIAAALYPSTIFPFSPDLEYRTPALDLNILKGKSGVTQGVPIPNEKMDVQPKLRVEASVDGDGVLTFDTSVDKNKEIKLNGTQGRRPDGKFGEFAGVEFGFGLQGSLIGAYQLQSSEWIVRSGYLGFNVYGSYSTPPYYFYAPPPVYFCLEIGGELDCNVRVYSFSSTNDLDPQFMLSSDALPKLTGVLGCGASDVLAVEGQVGFLVKFDLKGPPPICNKLGIGGKVLVQLVFFCFTLPLEIYSDTYWIIGGDKTTTHVNLFQAQRDLLVKNINRVTPANFSLVSRAYLKDAQLLKSVAHRTALRSGALEQILQYNGYPYSQPALAAHPTSLVLYIRDNAGRTDENRTELVAVQKDGTWPPPAPVWNDGTADFAPQLGVAPNGAAIALWNNVNTLLTNGAGLGTLFAHMEIAGAVRLPGTTNWLAANITSNTWLDYSPQLSVASNATALATWISNISNSPNGSATEPNIIQYARWNGTQWSAPGNIATNVPMLLWSTVAYNGSTGVFIAAIDEDNDQATISNQQLYAATFNGSTWSAFARVTTNSVQDTRPQAVYNSVGNLLVAWYQDGKIVTCQDDLNLNAATVAGVVGESSSAKDFRLVTGPRGQISLVWEDSADGTGPDPFLLNYDATLRCWSQPMRLFNETNYIERSFSGAYATNGALLLAYNRVQVLKDTNNVPYFGPTDLALLDCQIGGDLGLNAGDLSLSTPNPIPGEFVQVQALVRNLGELAASNVAAAFYDGDPGAGGLLIGAEQLIPLLPAASAVVVRVAWQAPATTNSRTLYSVVDPHLAQTDRNRANNTQQVSVMAPDLVILQSSAQRVISNQFALSVRLANQGGIAVTSAFPVVFHWGSPSGAVLQTVSVSGLVASAWYDAGFVWNMEGPQFTNASELVYVEVDAARTVPEFDVENNQALIQVTTENVVPEPCLIVLALLSVAMLRRSSCRGGMKSILLLVISCCATLTLYAANPVVSNVRVYPQTPPSKLVDVFYDVTSPNGNLLNVALVVSTNNGTAFNVGDLNLSGNGAGNGVAAGSNKSIVWDPTKTLPAILFNNCIKLRITATDTGSLPPSGAGMALIPAGAFTMGDTFSEGYSDEQPTHSVYISAFYMDKTEVTKAKWDEVYTWAVAHGYSFSAGAGKAANHPVQTVSWYDCVKWCNARSEKEGLSPCYTVGGNVYKTGQSAPDCNWSANGYRLPTEAEWEKAARGGAAGMRFPWSDVQTISRAQANYYGYPTYFTYDLGPEGYNPLFTPGGYPYTSPVGYFAANGYGLYDMAGNVWEWCWDWYGETYYASSPGSDPRGASSGTYRVLRGGGWSGRAGSCRVAFRSSGTPDVTYDFIGVRCVRGL